MTPEIEAMGGEPPPGYSSGGMRTKLVAARIATQAGCAMAIAYGHVDRPLARAGEGRALHLVPRRARRAVRRASAGSPARWRRSAPWWWMPARRARLPTVARCCRPACAASRARSSAAIRSWCAVWTATALARGLSAYASADAERIAGHRSDEIEAILGWRGRDEIIHRDDLCVALRPRSSRQAAD